MATLEERIFHGLIRASQLMHELSSLNVSRAAIFGLAGLSGCDVVACADFQDRRTNEIEFSFYRSIVGRNVSTAHWWLSVFDEPIAAWCIASNGLQAIQGSPWTYSSPSSGASLASNFGLDG